MKKKLLLADDDESVRKMVGRVLESTGYEVALAATAREAVAKFRAVRPDLVLLDVMMPEGDGWTAFSQISRIDTIVPVIVITAWPNQYELAVQKGIDALMEKPLDLPLLLQTIENLISEPIDQRTRRVTDPKFTTVHLAAASRPEPQIRA